MKSDKNNEFCEKCIDKYYLSSGDKKCILVENCKISKNENICIECNDYYCLDVKNGLCIDNDFLIDENIKFYFACIKTNENSTACEKCMDGYEIGEDGYCVDVSRCREKEDGECLKYEKELNDTADSYCANKIFGCIETIDEECLRCDNLLELDSCTECKEGYILFYGICFDPSQLEEEL